MKNELLKVKFGRNGPLVTKLGFGGIPIQSVSHGEAVKVVRYAYEKGIRFFDTARAYTTSEERIGEALADVRDQVFIATKSVARDRAGVQSDFEKSLNNLRTNYVDLFMFHNVMSKDQLDQILSEDGPYAFVKEQQQKGRIRLIGFSSHSVDTAILACKTGLFWSVEFPFNYLETQCLKELLPLTRQTGMGFIVMKPYAGGALSNARTALKWLYAKNVDVVIPGMMSCEQVDEAVEAVLQVEPLLTESGYDTTDIDLLEPPLSESERADIQKDIETLTKRFCRRCQYCLPCPNGIAVNAVVSAELVFNRTGWHRISDAQVEMLKKALSCVECGVCESRCPYQLPLTSLVKPMAQDLLARIERIRAGNQ